jgi:hypothetical protein
LSKVFTTKKRTPPPTLKKKSPPPKKTKYDEAHKSGSSSSGSSTGSSSDTSSGSSESDSEVEDMPSPVKLLSFDDLSVRKTSSLESPIHSSSAGRSKSQKVDDSDQENGGGIFDLVKQQDKQLSGAKKPIDRPSEPKTPLVVKQTLTPLSRPSSIPAPVVKPVNSRKPTRRARKRSNNNKASAMKLANTEEATKFLHDNKNWRD